MLTVIHNCEVLDSVIKFIAVDMVRDLITGKFSAKMLLQNPSMLKDSSATHKEPSIAIFSNMSSTLVVGCAPMATEFLGIMFTPIPFVAMQARDLFDGLCFAFKGTVSSNAVVVQAAKGSDVGGVFTACDTANLTYSDGVFPLTVMLGAETSSMNDARAVCRFAYISHRYNINATGKAYQGQNA